MELSGRFRFARDQREQGEFISALIGEARIGCRGLEGISLRIKVLRSDVQRLMDVPEIMHEQDQRYRLCNGSWIVFRFVASQDTNAEWNHVNEVELRTSNVARRILFIAEDGNICIVKFVMRGMCGRRV